MKHLIYRYPILKHALLPVLATRRNFRQRYVKRDRINHALMSLFHEPAHLSVAEFEGTFWINPKSHIFRRLVLDGYYEPILAELCRTLIDPDRDVIDIGANIGFFTVLSAKHTKGNVYAVEPTDGALALLTKNIDHNLVKTNVVVFDGAVSDNQGELTMEVIAGMEEYSSVCGITHPSAAGETVVTKRVRCTTLDELVVQKGLNPGFIKMDVEGAEEKALSGGWGVFERFRPTLISEFSPYLLARSGADWQALLRELRSRGYRLIDPIMPKVALGKREFGDLLAVPEEKYSADELMATVWEAHAKGKYYHDQKSDNE